MAKAKDEKQKKTTEKVEKDVKKTNNKPVKSESKKETTKKNTKGAKKETKKKANKKSFTQEVKAELKKVKWPTKEEMVKYSIAVLVFIVAFGLYFYGIDAFFAWISSLVKGL